MTRKTVAIIWLGIFFAAFAARAQGGPPLVTDDPGTPGKGNWEINIAAIIQQEGDVTNYQAPDLDINYGPTERIQLKLEVPWTTMGLQGHDTIDGLGNLNFGLKWRFIDQDGFSMSTYPQFEANSPTNAADRGLVDLGSKFYLPVELLWEGKQIAVGGEAGYYTAQYGSDAFFWGAYFQWQPSDKLDLLAEVHDEQVPGAASTDFIYNFGARIHFNDTYALLASAGSVFGGTRNYTPDLIAYLGLQIDLDTQKNERDNNEPANAPHARRDALPSGGDRWTR